MTNIEYVRLLINDSGKTKFANDTDITAFLTLNNNNIYLAAAAAIRAYCSKLSEAESFSVGSYSERANIGALLKIADSYEAKAQSLGASLDGNERGFDDVVEIALTEFNTVEILNNLVIKENL